MQLWAVTSIIALHEAPAERRRPPPDKGLSAGAAGDEFEGASAARAAADAGERGHVLGEPLEDAT